MFKTKGQLIKSQMHKVVNYLCVITHCSCRHPEGNYFQREHLVCCRGKPLNNLRCKTCKNNTFPLVAGSANISWNTSQCFVENCSCQEIFLGHISNTQPQCYHGFLTWTYFKPLTKFLVPLHHPVSIKDENLLSSWLWNVENQTPCHCVTMCFFVLLFLRNG